MRNCRNVSSSPITHMRRDHANSTMMHLDPTQIHLWIAFCDEIRDEALLQRYDRLLAPEEREQRRRFHFEIDQHRYLVTRALVRTALSRYAAVEPQEWTFTTNAYGKPEIANGNRRTQQITFNISHTRSLILLGITFGGALGVDVENCSAREPPLKIANQFFASEESVELQALPRAQQRGRFFEYWTLKESYIKARGMGLSIDLGSFGFQFPGERTVRISMRPGLDDPSRWRFWQFKPASAYLAAICAEAAETSQQLVARKLVPLLHEEVFDCEIVRTSEA
jgi:4'-phosphopantetheinyl transferase